MPISIRRQVVELIELVKQGKFLDAIGTYYADDATMQENLDPPRIGLAALLENERNVLKAVPDIHVARVESCLVDGDRVAIHWVFEFTTPTGHRRQLDEIAYQEWADGKIVRERFFYDPAQRGREVL